MSRRKAGGVRVLAAISMMTLSGTCGIAMATAQAASSAQAAASPLYKDASQPVEARVEDLLKRMTLEEKAAQLMTLWEQKAKVQTDAGIFSPGEASQNFPNGIGQFARPSDKRGVTQTNAGAAGASAGSVNRDAPDTAE